MVSAPSAVAMLALLASLAAVFSSSLYQLGTTTPAQAAQDLLPLAAMGALLTAVTSIYRQLHHRHAAAAAASSGTEVAAGVVCAAVGLLQFFLHDDVTQPRALGTAAIHVLPPAAAATFFLGMALVFVHVRAGAGGAVAGDGPVHTPVWILTEVTLGAAAGVIGLMALALYAE